MSDLGQAVRSARVRACEHCHRVGYLVGHGVARGYTDAGPDRAVRGHRLFCSPRGRSRGCGRTTTIWLASVVRGAITSASAVFRLATLLAAGARCAAAWREVSSMSVSTGYRVRRRLFSAQVHLRTTLSARAPPPEHAGGPLGQTLAHLARALGEHASFETFQLATEVGLFG